MENNKITGLVRHEFTNYSRPIEYSDFVKQTNGLQGLYSAFLKRSNVKRNNIESKLYIKEIKSGSIITELCTIATQNTELIEVANVLLPAFFQYFIKFHNFLAGKDSTQEAKDYTLSEYENYKNLQTPVINNEGDCNMTLNVNISGNNNSITINRGEVCGAACFIRI
jgi:hypothetical protein